MKLSDHALFDIVLTHDEVYKLRLAVSRQVEALILERDKAVKFGLSHEVEDHLIPRYQKIMDKLRASEMYWLLRGHFLLRFELERGSDDE